MMMPEIHAECRRLAERIGVAPSALPSFGRPQDDARPYIDHDRHGYHIVVRERGQERERETFTSPEALIEHVFRSITLAKAVRYELERRQPFADSRRLIWAHQINLLERLSPEWADAERRRMSEILRNHPFDDHAGVRTTLSNALREQGHSQEEAWDQACERFPLPKRA